MTELAHTPDDQELQLLVNNKNSGFEYRRRRQDDWRENYTLYRDRVLVNRITQRQSVNVPLMKQTIRSLMKDVDDMPLIEFQNLDNDDQAQVFKNEYWKWTISPQQNNMELKDIVDKKQVFLFGRTFDQMQIEDGRVKFTIISPEDILIDRFLDPTDIDTARFLIHTHIYRPFSYLESNTDYDQEKVAELKEWFQSEYGILKNETNSDMLQKKNQKMIDMGMTDIDSPDLGETMVELSMHFVYRKEDDDDEEQLYVYVEAENMKILMKKRQEEIVGTTKDHYWRNHFMYNTWADDLENTDFWSDGVADVVRTPNKVLNSYFSQSVENRALRNFGMHFYDNTQEGFVPQTWEPRAWGMYGVPGKPQDIMQQVPIPDLSEQIDEMQYIEAMVEKASGASATQQGVENQRQITLGEVQLALSEAKERVKGMSKFYTNAWYQRAYKFMKLIEAAPDKLDAVKLNKQGRNSNKMYSREVMPKDWMTKSGYIVRIWAQDEKNVEDTRKLERLNVAVSNIPGNPKLISTYQRKLLEYAGLTPDEITETMKYEEERQAMMAQMAQDPMMQAQMQAQGGQPQAQSQAPQQPQLPIQQ